MKKNLIVLSLTLSAFLTASGFASGFRCFSANGYKVKLYNHVDPSEGTRNPATFVLSSAEQGTLVVRHDSEISKENFGNRVEYTIVGNAETKTDSVTLRVYFREGIDEKFEMKKAAGTLLFNDAEGMGQAHDLLCTRYLKGK